MNKLERANLERNLENAQREYEKNNELFLRDQLSKEDLNTAETKKLNAEDALEKHTLQA